MTKVLFMGTPNYADIILKKLIEDEAIEVVGVFTQPDKPVGRKKILTPPPVKVRAIEHNIEVYQPKSLKEKEAIQQVCSIECDLIVVAAYGQILPKDILEYRPCINLHASILPKYRGASPIQQALLNGDSITGVTAMLMDEGLDTGDILTIQECEITPDETAPELFKKLTHIAASVTLEVVKNFSNYTPKPQDETQASYCKKIAKEDGLVEFNDAQMLYNKYRAFFSWPGVFLASGLKLKKIALHDTTSQNKKGEILEIAKDFMIVGCKKGSIKVYRLQPPSKKEMDSASYINGKRLSVGDTLL